MSEFDLTDDIVDAVVAHMNGDHAEDNVVICRGLGGRPDVTAARCVGLDHDAIVFAASGPAGPDGESEVRIPFDERLTCRAQIRAEVAAMFHRATDLLD